MNNISTDVPIELGHNLLSLLMFEQWDETTKNSLFTYLKLRQIEYIATDNINNNIFWTVLKVDNEPWVLTIKPNGSTFTTINID